MTLPYLTTTPPIGGVIKSTDEDFEVEEIPAHLAILAAETHNGAVTAASRDTTGKEHAGAFAFAESLSGERRTAPG